MKTLRVLHLASFEGNLGDNANHDGARRELARNLRVRLDYTEIEIREFFWKRRRFDEGFAALANQHDLVVIGGGNYFELWVEQSATGTSIDLTPEIFDQIRAPMLFHALGVDPAQGASDAAVGKFRAFLDRAFASPRCLVSVRNDGSLDAVRSLLGDGYASRVHHVPDGGFFAEANDVAHAELPVGKRIMGINLAGDMLERRFDPSVPDGLDAHAFEAGFAGMLGRLLDGHEDLHLVFVPHIYKDLEIIFAVLKRLEDRHARRRVTVAPYLHGPSSHDYIGDLYRKCDLVLGNRFHANILAIANNVPSIGLVNYPQIHHLYRELDLLDRAVDVNRVGFEARLEALAHASLASPAPLRARYADVMAGLRAEIRAFHATLDAWLARP